MTLTDQIPFYPSLASGLIFRLGSESNEYFGSCASIYNRTFALTAAHCVPKDISGLNVFYKLGGSRLVTDFRVHPKSDVALLKLEQIEDDPGASQVYTGIDPQMIDAGEFISYGYPAEGTNGEGFVARSSRGYFQRYFMYEDPAGLKYLAGEMNIPAWGGMSGSAVFYLGAQRKVMAIITGNYESYMVDYQSERVQEGNTIRSFESRRVINYGISAMLSGLVDWLEESKSQLA